MKIQLWAHNRNSVLQGMIMRQINHWSNLHWKVMYLGSTAGDSSCRPHSSAGFLWHYIADMSWMEVLTCCKHEDIQDVQERQKIGMSLWSRSSTQEGLVLPSHEADEAPCGEQLLGKYPQKQMKKICPCAYMQYKNHRCFCAPAWGGQTLWDRCSHPQALSLTGSAKPVQHVYMLYWHIQTGVTMWITWN